MSDTQIEQTTNQTTKRRGRPARNTSPVDALIVRMSKRTQTKKSQRRGRPALTETAQGKIILALRQESEALTRKLNFVNKMLELYR